MEVSILSAICVVVKWNPWLKLKATRESIIGKQNLCRLILTVKSKLMRKYKYKEVIFIQRSVLIHLRTTTPNLRGIPVIIAIST